MIKWEHICGLSHSSGFFVMRPDDAYGWVIKPDRDTLGGIRMVWQFYQKGDPSRRKLSPDTGYEHR